MKKLILLLFIPLVFSCSEDEENTNSNQLFRSIQQNTFWEINGDLMISFSVDKIFYHYEFYPEDNESDCVFSEEGSFSNIYYDGCYYDLTYVIIEEDGDTLIAREISTELSSSDSWCNNEGSVQETTVTFQILNENVMQVTVDYVWNGGASSEQETFTYTKTTNSFSTNICNNNASQNWLW